MNIERLLAVKQAILNEPNRYDQQWFRTRDETCGTRHCIGGWAIALFGKDEEQIFHSSYARKLLDLDEIQAEKLFFESPKDFDGIWDSYTKENAEQRAKLAAKRIDFFIKTNGTDVE